MKNGSFHIYRSELMLMLLLVMKPRLQEILKSCFYLSIPMACLSIHKYTDHTVHAVRPMSSLSPHTIVGSGRIGTSLIRNCIRVALPAILRYPAVNIVLLFTDIFSPS